MQFLIRALILVVLCTMPALAGTEFWSDTTLTKETSNNTSAAATFKTQINGNVAPGNVSNVPIRSLLYPGANTVILAHFMPWFGGTNHIDVGYRSDDYDQVTRQIQDMKRRGIDGLVLDWYGPSSPREEQTAQYVRGYASTDLDFRFAIMEDVGALKKCAATAGCNLTDRLIADLRYIVNTYTNDWGYLRIGSRPVIFFFGLEKYTLDWGRVRAEIGPQPMFIFRNSGGFTAQATDGAFAWFAPITSDYDSYQSIPYLENFYETAKVSSGRLAVGSAFKGFNDVLASWAPPGGRHIAQLCGQTWLDSFATISRYYSSGNQLPMLQLNTWNDYEEGTEIETGIDNCFSISASVTSSSVSWTISGAERTIHAYRVFISQDGEKLMTLADVAPGTRSLDLATFGFAQGTYKVFVKAIGKPSILNRMSNAATFVVGTGTPPPTDPTDPNNPTGPTDPTDPTYPTDPQNPPDEDLVVSVLPSILKVSQGQNAMASVNIYGASNVQLSCSGLPKYTTCSFGPATASANSASSTLTIRTSETIRVSRNHTGLVLAFASFGFAGIVIGGLERRRVVSVIVITVLSFSLVACGAFGARETESTSHPELMMASKGEFSIEVKAINGKMQASTRMTVVVQ